MKKILVYLFVFLISISLASASLPNIYCEVFASNGLFCIGDNTIYPSTCTNCGTRGENRTSALWLSIVGNLNTTGDITANSFNGSWNGSSAFGDASYQFNNNNFNGSGNFTGGKGTFGSGIDGQGLELIDDVDMNNASGEWNDETGQGWFCTGTLCQAPPNGVGGAPAGNILKETNPITAEVDIIYVLELEASNVDSSNPINITFGNITNLFSDEGNFTFEVIPKTTDGFSITRLIGGAPMAITRVSVRKLILSEVGDLDVAWDLTVGNNLVLEQNFSLGGTFVPSSLAVIQDAGANTAVFTVIGSQITDGSNAPEILIQASDGGGAGDSLGGNITLRSGDGTATPGAHINLITGRGNFEGNIILDANNDRSGSTGKIILALNGGDIWIDEDSSKLFFGELQDSYIGYDGTHLIIDPDVVGSGQLKVSGSLNVTEESHFRKDIRVNGTVFATAINISNSSFSLTANENVSTKFILHNINSGENATAVIIAKNDVGGTMSIGIGSSNFMIGNTNYQNITALFSKSRGDMIFANFFKKAFVWLYNPSDDNNPNNLVEIMRLDKNGLNVSGNLTIRDFGSINQLVIGNYTPTDLSDSDSLTVVDGFDLIHTSTHSDDHAFEIDFDAQGFGDAKAMFIDYITGNIIPETNEEVIFININQVGATGGHVTGLEIVTTNGSAKVTGLEVGVGVHPIEQLSGEFANMDSALHNTDNVLASFTSTANNITIFGSDNDYITIGSSAKFEELEFVLSTTASGAGIKPIFYHSTGVGDWDEFSPGDGTNGMRNTGVIIWEDSDLTNWNTGIGSEYLIRINRTANSLSTPPIELLVQLAEAVEYHWDKDARLSIEEIKINSLVGTYSNGEAYVCVYDNGTIFAKDGVCS